MLGMTLVAEDRCVGRVKAVEVGQRFETHPALRTCAQQTHQTSWSKLSGKAPWLGCTSSVQLKIKACSAISNCVCVCVWLCICVARVWGHSWAAQETDGVRSHVPDCCCFNFPVWPPGTNVVLFTHQTYLSLQLFRCCSPFSLRACSTAGEWFSRKRTVAERCLSCFLLEISMWA